MYHASSSPRRYFATGFNWGHDFLGISTDQSKLKNHQKHHFPAILTDFELFPSLFLLFLLYAKAVGADTWSTHEYSIRKKQQKQTRKKLNALAFFGDFVVGWGLRLGSGVPTPNMKVPGFKRGHVRVSGWGSHNLLIPAGPLCGSNFDAHAKNMSAREGVTRIAITVFLLFHMYICIHIYIHIYIY
jgi:hypothetical protein